MPIYVRFDVLLFNTVVLIARVVKNSDSWFRKFVMWYPVSNLVLSLLSSVTVNWIVCRGVMPFGQRKRNLEKLRTRGRKSKQAEAKNSPEITNGTMVCANWSLLCIVLGSTLSSHFI